MEELTLTFFPFPHVFKGERRPGLLQDWPERCSDCDRQCERSAERGLRLCSYGVNFQRIDDDLLVAGVVVRDYPGVPTRARSKMIKAVGPGSITRHQLEAAVERAATASRELEDELRARKDAIVEEYRNSRGYERDAVRLLRPDLQNVLSQVHDYKQFVQQISQNIDVILETRFPGESLDDKLAKAEHEEAAIYWAARLMDEKLETALFLLYPDRIHEAGFGRPFRFHGLVRKYLKIYERQMDAKGVKVAESGKSFGKVEGNPHAIAVIPHALIDNAVKYAPPNSRILVSFTEKRGRILFSVQSLGPPILPDEKEHIFNPFFRGSEAARRSQDGMGFGLAAAHLIAEEMGIDLSFSQADHREKGDNRLTTFDVSLPLAQG